MVLASSSSSSSKAIFAFQRPSSVFLLLFLTTAVFLLSLADPAMIPVLGVALTDRDDDDVIIIIIIIGMLSIGM